MTNARPSGTAALRGRDIMVVFGTRPEAIKLAPVIRLLGDAATVVYTGQHYDSTLGSAVAVDLGLGRPDHQLGVGGLHRGRQIGVATAELTDLMLESDPDVVVVQGDTNAGLAGALAANAVEVPLVHVEAGLRSFDRAMPEEHNRVLIDHLADVCAAPTAANRDNLLAEGIGADRVVVTGNTIIEAVASLLPSPDVQSAVQKRHGLDSAPFVIATIHRPENVDDLDVLRSVLTQLARCPVPVVLPLHPRTRARLDEAGMSGLLAAGSIRVFEPLPPTEFLALSAAAPVWVTDSGGLQEEATILRRRAIVVRRSTERPEALGTFSTLIDHASLAHTLIAALDRGVADLHDLDSPFGDGQASRRIVDAVGGLIGGRQPIPP